MVAMTREMSANTARGAVSMITWTSLMITSVMPSAIATMGLDFSEGIRVRAMPMARAVNTTCSIEPSASEANGFLGTMSRSVSQTSGATAVSIFWPAWTAPALARESRSSALTKVPGLATFANTRPTVIATAVVHK